jgi:hypothetical protein
MKEINDLEMAFQASFNNVHHEIQEKLTAASKLISEAVILSDKYGIPFRPNDEIMWCRPSYMPTSFKQKFKDIDEEFVYELTEAHGGYDYDGWQVSQVC